MNVTADVYWKDGAPSRVVHAASRRGSASLGVSRKLKSSSGCEDVQIWIRGSVLEEAAELKKVRGGVDDDKAGPTASFEGSE